MGDVVQEENLRRQQEEIEVLNSIYEENMILGPICLKHYIKITWTPVKKCVMVTWRRPDQERSFRQSCFQIPRQVSASSYPGTRTGGNLRSWASVWAPPTLDPPRPPSNCRPHSCPRRRNRDSVTSSTSFIWITWESLWCSFGLSICGLF